MRWVLVAALAAGACSPEAARSTPKDEAMKHDDAPAAKAGEASGQKAGTTREIKSVTVPGRVVSLFEGPDGAEARLTGKDGATLTGAAAFHAARAAIGEPDPEALARLAMVFLEDGVEGADPWTAAAPFGEGEHKALAHPPRREGGAVVYWRLHRQRADLVRATLDVEAATVETTDANTIEREGADPLAAARADLASDNLSIRKRGLKTLAQSDDPAAHTLLYGQLAEGPAPARAVAAEVIATRADEAATAALVEAVKSDADVAVRRAALLGLRGRTSVDAKAALLHVAANDADPTLKALAMGLAAQMR